MLGVQGQDIDNGGGSFAVELCDKPFFISLIFSSTKSTHFFKGEHFKNPCETVCYTLKCFINKGTFYCYIIFKVICKTKCTPFPAKVAYPYLFFYSYLPQFIQGLSEIWWTICLFIMVALIWNTATNSIGKLHWKESPCILMDHKYGWLESRMLRLRCKWAKNEMQKVVHRRFKPWWKSPCRVTRQKAAFCCRSGARL